MALKLITPAEVDVVTLAEIKAHVRVVHNDDDATLTSLVKAAVSHFEVHTGILGIAFGQQSWELYYDEFPCGSLQIPLPPLISVASVEYLDPVSGLYVVWASSNYSVDAISRPGWVVPIDDWPTPKDAVNAVKVTFTAGFGATNAAIPESLRLAVMMLAAHWYQNREGLGSASDMAALPFAVDALVAQHKLWRV